MTHSTDNQFIEIENAAHGGAFGSNSIPEPTEAQRKSGNYKMGRVDCKGLAIAIEQPRGTYRTGIDSKTGKRWISRMAAHYGYISRTKGNDGDGVDCFLGPFLQSETVYVINLLTVVLMSISPCLDFQMKSQPVIRTLEATNAGGMGWKVSFLYQFLNSSGGSRTVI